MSKTTWMHWLVAAILVLVAGAVMVAAEERIEVRVEKEGSDEVSVDINGVTEVIRIDDLAEGESRTFDVGDHELVVTRIGDELEVITEGHGFGDLGKSLNTALWISKDGEEIKIQGDCDDEIKKMIVMNVEGEGEAGHRVYKLHVDGDHPVEIDELITGHAGDGHGAVFFAGEGDLHHPMMVRASCVPADTVKYRCEETGSVLFVSKDDAIEDSYICPATGCVMTRVSEPETRVITITKKVEIEDED